MKGVKVALVLLFFLSGCGAQTTTKQYKDLQLGSQGIPNEQRCSDALDSLYSGFANLIEIGEGQELELQLSIVDRIMLERATALAFCQGGDRSVKAIVELEEALERIRRVILRRMGGAQRV